jgi:hypothetical protein
MPGRQRQQLEAKNETKNKAPPSHRLSYSQPPPSLAAAVPRPASSLSALPAPSTSTSAAHYDFALTSSRPPSQKPAALSATPRTNTVAHPPIRPSALTPIRLRQLPLNLEILDRPRATTYLVRRLPLPLALALPTSWIQLVAPSQSSLCPPPRCSSRRCSHIHKSITHNPLPAHPHQLLGPLAGSSNSDLLKRSQPACPSPSLPFQLRLVTAAAPRPGPGCLTLSVKPSRRSSL